MENESSFLEQEKEEDQRSIIVPGKDLKHVQVIKIRRVRKLQKVDKRVIFGENIDNKRYQRVYLKDKI